MSFLNPVNEPVLRFKSTDANAPQINYNARVAGDVKAVLKACLITGYGTTASAGWSIVNEVSHVAEFVSPSAAISGYRLGIDDTSVSSTTWYYQYQDTRVNPNYNSPVKSIDYINRSSAANKWELLVTGLGLFFVEMMHNSVIGDIVSRITYWGAVKSALKSDTGQNIAFYNLGHQATMGQPYEFFTESSKAWYRLSGITSTLVAGGVNTYTISQQYGLHIDTKSAIEIRSPTYLYQGISIVAELPALMMSSNNGSISDYGAYDTYIEGRPALSLCLTLAGSATSIYTSYSRTILLRLDYWEY